MTDKILIWQGEEILKSVDKIASMRIDEFKNFPYLYAGNIKIEKKYLASFVKDDRSAVIVAYQQNEMAAILTGMPLVSHLDPVNGAKKIFLENGLDPLEYYYCGEFIVRAPFRNRGIAKTLYMQQVEFAKKCGFNKFCLMTVDREKHLYENVDYFDADLLWKKLGFVKTNMKVKLSWPTIKDDKSISEQEHTLTFWVNDCKNG